MIVHSNGSHFAGEALNSVQELIELLDNPHYYLDPSFESSGDFFHSNGSTALVFGNFANLSHVFRISGTHQELLDLARAIAAHKKTDRYLRAFARHYGSFAGLKRRRAQIAQLSSHPVTRKATLASLPGELGTMHCHA